MYKIMFTILIITILGLLGTFFWNNIDEDPITAGEIHSLLEQGETQIDLTTLTNLEWTTVDLFGPYTTDEMIEESTGIKFNFLFGGIDVMETNFLLVFADDKKAIKTINLSRKYGDYTVKDNKFLIVE